jgi:hypothetical protein
MDPLDGLADIEMLPPPPVIGSTVALLVLASLIAAFAWYHWKMRKRTPAALATVPASREALQRLATLQGEWEAGAIGDREAAYRLCALLRIGLGLRVLDPETVPAGVDEEIWRRWHRELRHVRYRPAEGALTAAAFTTAKCWLQRDHHA